MSTPFSPFVKKSFKSSQPKRRESQLPSNLIDWEAPEIPELEKERIIYEEHIKNLIQEHEVERLIDEAIFSITHECVLESYRDQIDTIRAEVDTFKAEVDRNMVLYLEKKSESEDLKKKLDAMRNQLNHYKKLAKSK